MNKRIFLKRGLLAGVSMQFPFLSWASIGGETKILPDTESQARNFEFPKPDKKERIFPAIGTIFYANFRQHRLQADWVTVGDFKPTTQGLQSPAKGGWEVYTYWNKLITLDEDMVTCQVEVVDVKSVFAIARISNQKKGTVAEADLSARKLKLYAELPAPGAVPTAVVAQVDINFPIVTRRAYKLILQKISEQYLVKLYDTVTHRVAEIDYLDTGKTPSSGKAWNFPGFIFQSGRVNLVDFTFSSGLPRSPKVLVIGDSIADGDTIRLQPDGGFTNRWAGLLATTLNYNVTIIARGGETSGHVNDKLPLLSTMLHAPAYVIYAIGTNDTDFGTWRTHYCRFQDVFKAKGAEIIPATLFPRRGREAFCAEVNQFIKSSNNRFLDFNKALTIDGDGISPNHTLLLPDNLHPSPAGHLKMFEQLKIDLPDLFS